MSLLLQALQKASKTRGAGDTEPGGDPLDSEELSLEPMGSAAAEPVLHRETAGATPTPAQAAAVMQASRAPAFDPLDYAREHYMVVFIGLAVLVGIGYGAYVYIQVSHPGLLRSTPRAAAPVAATPPVAPQSVPAVATPAQVTAEAAAKISGMPADATAAGQAPARAAVVMEPAPQASAAQGMATALDAEPPVRTTASRPRRQATEPMAKSYDEDGVETVTIQTPRTPAAEARRPPVAASASVDPDLLQAYDALQAGDTAKAKVLYAGVLQADARSIDALLGLGAIAWKEGRVDEAAQHYQRVLELEPRNAYAQAGLISIMGGADPQASETRLRQLIAREPSAFLYFTLGNLYADQGQWPGAQQAYFQAYQLQPDNADYAFNLAVGLEHLGQTGPALDYYRKALDLSFRKGRANFDQSLVIQRVGQLSSRVGQ